MNLVYMKGIALGVALACITVVASERHKRQNEDFVCPFDGMFADPLTCRRFYQCVDNHPYMNRCPPGLYFDDREKFCTFKTEAKCGPLPVTEAPTTTPDPNEATKCDVRHCVLPYCYCSKDGTRIPNNMDRDSIPQLVMLTFDDAVNELNINYYRSIFNGSLINPNDCPIKGTFFLSHEYTDYQMVQDLYHEGHEIAIHTVSHERGLESAGYDRWKQEIVGMREIIGRWANISQDDILGVRAPFLKPGRNDQFDVMTRFGSVYDSSLTIPPLSTAIWPYTLDHKIPHECRSGTCPTSTYPGVWEIPLNAHYVTDFDGGHCNYMDQCVLHNHSPTDVFNWLKEDFERHYLKNKAPYLMPFHTNWFQLRPLELGLHKFLKYLTTLPDVWFVTMTQSLLWITDPQPLSNLHRFEAWDCTKQRQRPEPCLHDFANKCPLDHAPNNTFPTTRYLTTCNDCPNRYPWLGDAHGTGNVNDVYEPDLVDYPTST